MRTRAHTCWLIAAIVGVLMVLVGIGALVVNAEAEPDDEAVTTELIAAVHSDDRTRFAALFVPSADSVRVETLWQNLRQVELVTLSSDPEGGWQVEWRAPGEPGLAGGFIQPAWQCGRRSCRLVDIVQYNGRPTPIWLTEAVQVQRAGAVTLIGPDTGDWLEVAALAAQDLAASRAPLLAAVDGLVIEVPGSITAFEQVMAAPAVDFRDAGAITWRLGAAVRVVVNPAGTANLDARGRELLLLHELAHAATDPLGPPAEGQLWVSEGLAEYVMLQSSQEQADHSLAVLAASCPLDSEPPSDDDFRDPRTQQYAYAWSAWTVAGIVATGPQAPAEIESLWKTSGAVPMSRPADGPCG